MLFMPCVCHVFQCLRIAALWSPAEKGLTSWLLFVMFNCVLSLSHVVSWVRCGTRLYRFLIFAAFLTFTNYQNNERSRIVELVSGILLTVYKLVHSSNYRLSCRFHVIDDVIQKVQRHHDLIKTHATFIKSTCNNAVNMRAVTYIGH